MVKAFTTPGLDLNDGRKTCERLADRLVALLDLSLVLKHIHWNVVGPSFIGVHLMLDPQVEAVRLMVDDTAERIATLGASPNGLPGYLVKSRSWDDYALGRATVMEHLAALDIVYRGVVEGHRQAIDELEDLDLVSQDMLIDQTSKIEQFLWFVRAHLEDAGGHLLTGDVKTERQASRRTRKTNGSARA